LNTLALEEIYADPHKLDACLASVEPVAVVHAGQAVAEFVPHRDVAKIDEAKQPPAIDFRARFLKTSGPDAFKGKISVAEQFEELRRPREL
jgi:hypothetical protein